VFLDNRNNKTRGNKSKCSHHEHDKERNAVGVCLRKRFFGTGENVFKGEDGGGDA
jgi:hypothetical protein